MALIHATDKMLPLVATFKVIFVGKVNAGKTSICSTYEHKERPQVKLPSTVGVGFFMVQRKTASGAYVILQLFDTAGMERFRAITRSYYSDSNGAVVVVDISDIATSADSLTKEIDQVRTLIAEVREKARVPRRSETQEAFELPVVIFAHKIDLLETCVRDDLEKYRHMIAKMQALQELAKELRNCQYRETSIADITALDASFDQFFDHVIGLWRADHVIGSWREELASSSSSLLTNNSRNLVSSAAVMSKSTPAAAMNHHRVDNDVVDISSVFSRNDKLPPNDSHFHECKC